nr:retrovirus-related Pol polyprotein from transposon TNT 1-94 [Tanacetum cinerariifolium]
DKEVNMTARDYDDALVCCIDNTIDDRIMDSGTLFHATYCKEKLERYIPGLKKRLIYVGQLDEKGYHIGFGDQQWKVTKGSLVVARGNKRGSIYMVEGMKILASKGRIPNLQKAIVGFCEPCVLGKQKKVSFVKSGNIRKLQRLKLVHTDVYGLTSIASIGGSCYYVTLIDDSNRKVLVYFLMKWKATVENETNLQDSKSHKVVWRKDVTFNEDSLYGAKAATYSSNLTKPNQKDQVVLEDLPKNLANKSIVIEHGLSSEITQSPDGSSDTSEGSKNSGSFKDSRRSYKEDSEDKASSEKGRAGYKRYAMDHCCYLKKVGSSSIILLLYVDDMLVTGSNMEKIKKLKRELYQEFKMKDLGPIKNILGMSIIKDRMKVGSVMYTTMCTRLDIAHAVGVVCRFMSNPRKEHWKAIKWLLRYLKGTSMVTRCFCKKEVVLEGFSDLDYRGCLDSGESTTSYVFTVGGIEVSWMSRIQKCVAMLTIEYEYMVIIEAGKELVWLKNFLKEIDRDQTECVLFCDNKSAIHLVKNPMFHGQTKHIKIRYHYIRELVSEGTLSLKKILEAKNPTDMLTKAEVRENRLIGLEMVQETTNKVAMIKDKLKVARDHQKSYADNRRKPLELKLKYLADANLLVPLKEVKVEKTLRFVKEPKEIMDREVKKLKRSRVAIVKVRWNSKRAPEFIWVREDFMKAKYLNLFAKRVDGSTS